MQPKYFPEVNTLFGADQEEYKPLPALKLDNGHVITCWELSDEEIERLTKTRELYVAVATANNPLQPMFITTDKNDLNEI